MSRLLKSKYFPKGGICNASVKGQDSWIWKSWSKARGALALGLRMRVGDGRNIRIWESPWVPNIRNFKPVGLRGKDRRVERVCDLLESDGRSWNHNLIAQIFTEEETKEIINIPLLNDGSKDRFIWVPEKKGSFTVKSCYKEIMKRANLLKAKASSSNTGDLQRKMWNCTWSIQIKPKLKSFLWRCIHDSLPVAEKLCARGMLPTPWCQVCGNGVESLIHVLFTCEKAKTVWSIAPISWNKKTVTPDCFKGWWSDLCNAKKGECWEDRVELSVYILWWLWRTRNLWIFEKKTIADRDVVKKASGEWCEFARVKKSGAGIAVTTNSNQVGQICLFVSACMVPGMGSGFGGVAVIKNQRIMCMKWQVFLPNCYDASEAILHGVQHALWTAFLKDWKEIELCMDDEAALMHLKNSHPFDDSKKAIADNIYMLVDLALSCSFETSCSDFICVASSLALEAVSSSSSHEWLC